MKQQVLIRVAYWCWPIFNTDACWAKNWCWAGVSFGISLNPREWLTYKQTLTCWSFIKDWAQSYVRDICTWSDSKETMFWSKIFWKNIFSAAAEFQTWVTRSHRTNKEHTNQLSNAVAPPPLVHDPKDLINVSRHCKMWMVYLLTAVCITFNRHSATHHPQTFILFLIKKKLLNLFWRQKAPTDLFSFYKSNII
jgi:hypothetical protein